VARLGGDEFAILLPDLTSRADLVRPLDALRALLNTPIQYKGQGVRISTSIGAALHDDPDADASHLRKNADIALYKAKDLGRDRVVVFEPEMRSEIEKRLELLRDVRAAIPRGEFVLYYQPVVGLHESAVTGFEALMRWNHPDKGVLPPAEFMSAFEDQDLSVQLGSLAIETALKQMRAWMDQGLPFGTVAINLSAAQFRTGRLADDLRGRLQRWGVPPERLTVEVTENVYLGWGAEIVSETIRALHDHGVGIALDDFGTGYASLANLRQFPIDQLKIDKSFVQNADDDAVVRAVINLGASMGMEVVAEGVERPDQLNQLTRYGCRHVQGFHFAKPMPPEQVPGYLSDFKAAQKAQSAA
jgi:EAL domain-containing protein (putative c-di-GMP-specific phosphodiesterase class I)